MSVCMSVLSLSIRLVGEHVHSSHLCTIGSNTELNWTHVSQQTDGKSFSHTPRRTTGRLCGLLVRGATLIVNTNMFP